MATIFDTAKKTEMYQFFSIAFNAAPGVTYMKQLQDAVEFGMSTKEIVNVFTGKVQFTSVYPIASTDTDFAANLIENVVGTSATAAAKFEAMGDVKAAIASGMSRGDVVYQIFTNLAALKGDAKWGGTATMMANKVAVADYYTATLATDTTDLAALRGALAGVTATTNVSTPAALAATQFGAANTTLTVGQDNLFGTSIADTFNAMVAQNMYGSQTNQLASGDKLNGGAGVDTLLATVQKANPLGGTATQAITPTTTSVEKAYFTALTADNTAATGAAEAVVINAKSMTGLTNVGSVQSDASLTIQNLTTLTDTGAYADRRNTDSVTIRMDHSGNDKALDAQSNLTVLFDNDYLKADSANTGSLELRAVNVLSLKDKALPLFGFTSVSFKVGTVTVTAPLNDAIRALSGQPAYEAVVAAINTAITAAGITNVTAALGIVRSAFFSDDAGGYLAQSLAGTYFPIIVTATNSQVLAVGVIALDSSVVSANYLNTEILGGVSTAFAPVTSNIELNKVGRGAEGGALVVGGMATDLNNVWDYSATALKEGVEKFVITVSGDTTQMSSLSNLSSTNNTLHTVEVTFATNQLADLIIGNHNTAGVLASVNGATAVIDAVANVSSVQNLALKDVRVFTAKNSNTDATIPASVQTNDVTLNAYLSNEVVAKFMNRADNVANAAVDNAEFAYTTSSGNDSLNLNISKSNLAASGTAAREDFKLTIDAGAGNNTVVTQIGDGKATSATDPWYVNQSIQKNLLIITGANNDVVKVNGAGTWDIKTGAGNDAIYSDNSGRKVIDTDALIVATAESNAVWVFNSANQTQATGMQPLFDLTSAVAVTAAAKVANLTLTVSYRGINVPVTVGDTAGALGGSVDDLTINQAIKAAINGNVYLSKLLSAQDGTGRTLVVTSLTDGVFSDADLTISLSSPTALTAAQTASGAAFISAVQMTALGLTGGSAVAGGRFDSAIAEDASARTAETTTVTWGAMAAVVGSQTIGGVTITSTAVGFTATQVATVAGGGAVAGLTLTTTGAYTVAAPPAPGAVTNVFTSVALGNTADLLAGTFTGAGNAAPSGVVLVQGTSVSITGAVSTQPNANVIDAGLGLDTVVLSSSALAKETVNVYQLVADADVVFNAGAGATISVDASDTVITTSGIVLTGGVGSVSIVLNGVTGTALADTINASAAATGQTLSGLAGNDTITASLLGSTVIGGDGADVITFAATGTAGDTLVLNSLVGADTIVSFIAADDSINVSKAVFAGVGAIGALATGEFEAGAGLVAAATATGRFVYNTTTGALFYDADGSAAVAPVLVATLTGIPSLAFGDFNIIA